jgi:hypothetical protein
VATARCRSGGGRIEQGGDVGELARKLFVRKTVRRDIAGLLHGHTRSFSQDEDVAVPAGFARAKPQRRSKEKRQAL